jgi:hypothetical protein
MLLSCLPHRSHFTNKSGNSVDATAVGEFERDGHLLDAASHWHKRRTEPQLVLLGLARQQLALAPNRVARSCLNRGHQINGFR